MGVPGVRAVSALPRATGHGEGARAGTGAACRSSWGSAGVQPFHPVLLLPDANTTGSRAAMCPAHGSAPPAH